MNYLKHIPLIITSQVRQLLVSKLLLLLFLYHWYFGRGFKSCLPHLSGKITSIYEIFSSFFADIAHPISPEPNLLQISV